MNQVDVEVEVIVVDDGSPDDPLRYLGKLAQDERVRYIRQENAGLPAARNRGIKESRGHYLNFLDADDWLDERFGTELSAAIEAAPEVGFAYSDLQRVVEGGSRADHELSLGYDLCEEYSVGVSKRTTSGDILPSLLRSGYFTPNCVLVPKAVLDDVGLFDDSLGGHADWDMWIRIVASGRPAVYVDKKLAYYRLHGKNMSMDKDHMSSTQRATLKKLFITHPARAAEAVQTIQQFIVEEEKRNTRVFLEQQHWIAELEAAKKWHEAQSQLWEKQLIVEEEKRNTRVFLEQQHWIAELEAAKKWHEAQSQLWERRYNEERSTGSGTRLFRHIIGKFLSGSTRGSET